MALVAQAELMGVPFTRSFKAKQGGEIVRVPQQRRVRVGAVLNDETGDVAFRAVSQTDFDFSSLPHLPLHGTIFDGSAHEGQALKTVLKKGSSTPFVDIDTHYRASGATLESPPKESGFSLPKTREEIARERKRKKTVETCGNEVAAILEGGHKRPAKTGGFFSSSTPYEIARERRRKIQQAKQLKAQLAQEFVEFP